MHSFYWYIALIFLVHFTTFDCSDVVIDGNLYKNPLQRRNSNMLRMVMGTCVYQNEVDQPLWQWMVVAEPDLILLLGDNVYLDNAPGDGCSINQPNGELGCFNFDYVDTTWYENSSTIKQEYDVLLNKDQFTINKNVTITNSTTFKWPVDTLIIWDDHDFCYNNAHGNCSFKNLTKEAFFFIFGNKLI